VVATAVVIMVVATAVVIMVVATAATAVVIIVVATAVVIMELITLILINLPEQKVGKIEVMETLLKIPNMKMAEAEEKEESQTRAKYQMRIIINNPFLQALKLN
jgi:hypothetical protein